jgi:hypothetical protein
MMSMAAFLLLLHSLPNVFDVRIENRRELIDAASVERFVDRARYHFHLAHVAALETTRHRIPDIGKVRQMKEPPNPGKTVMDDRHRPCTSTGTGGSVLIADLRVLSVRPRDAMFETAKFAKITGRAAATIEVGDSVGQFPDSSSFCRCSASPTSCHSVFSSPSMTIECS